MGICPASLRIFGVDFLYASLYGWVMARSYLLEAPEELLEAGKACARAEGMSFAAFLRGLLSEATGFENPSAEVSVEAEVFRPVTAKKVVGRQKPCRHRVPVGVFCDFGCDGKAL